MWNSYFSVFSITLLHIATLVSSQNDPAEFKHELPPGVELVNPKDFGLTDEQLGGLLSNVKVLGGSQIGDTKTQILTVGFEGDENLNFDDFDIPGLTDRKPADMPDKDKEIASVAFEKFKEFFKDPKKAAQIYQPPQPPPPSNSNRPRQPPQPQPEVKVNYSPEPNHQQSRNAPPQPRQQQHSTNPPPRQYHHRVNRPSQESLQQHYPVQLTQPQNQNSAQNVNPTTSRTIPRNHVQPHSQQENLNNHRPQHGPPPQPSRQQSPPPPPLRHSSHAIAFTNNNQPTANFNEEEFGARVPPTTPKQLPQYNPPQNQKYYAPPHQNQVNSDQEEKPLQVVHQHEQTYSTLPPGNFQRFTIYSQPKTPTSPPPERTARPQQQGQVVRNQLLFENNIHDGNENSYQSSSHERQQEYEHPIPGVVPPHDNPQEYRTITQTQFPHPPQRQIQRQPVPPQPTSFQNPSPSPSSSIPSTVSLPPRFPDPQQRPVSHIYIQHGGGSGGQGSSPPVQVQQTSFHPRFQAPTRFSNDFTPSVNHITTPSPPQHFDVTPSSPMILISTNENAITDPKRMELLRKQQRAMEEKRRLQKQQEQQASTKERQPHALNYNIIQDTQQKPQQALPTHFNGPASQNQNSNQNFNQITEPKQQNYNSQNSYTQTQYRQQYSQNNNGPNNQNNQKQHQYQTQQQNSFNFQTQQQQHQLHTLQQNVYFNSQSHPLPPRTYYQSQQQQLAQGSNNYPSVPIGIQQPPPPPHNFQYYGTRHKRGGYRHRLSTLLRGLWGDRDY